MNNILYERSIYNSIEFCCISQGMTHDGYVDKYVSSSSNTQYIVSSEEYMTLFKLFKDLFYQCKLPLALSRNFNDFLNKEVVQIETL